MGALNSKVTKRAAAERPGLFPNIDASPAPAPPERGAAIDTAAIAAWIGTLTIPQGEHEGELFTVLPWQDGFLRRAFAPGVRVAGLGSRAHIRAAAEGVEAMVREETACRFAAATPTAPGSTGRRS